jgi:zinc transporter, ZIP family
MNLTGDASSNASIVVLINRSDWITPLILSSLAGLSTCVGAAVAFCLERQLPSSSGNAKRKRKVGHAHMAFALSLAGSVMITVSITSILPESFLLDDDVHYTPIGSLQFWQRCIAFGVGCALYALLSTSIFPEPDEILGFTFDENLNETYDTINVMTNISNRTGIQPIGGSEDDLLLLLDDDEDPDLTSLPLITSNGSVTSTAFQRKKYNANASFDEPIDDPNTPLAQLQKSNARCDGSGKSKADTTNGPVATLSFLSNYTRGMDLTDSEARRKWRVTMLLFISLAVHNFPEGLAVAASAMHSSRLGISTTIAIALHNIPEGIAIAIPCLAARPGSPWLAFGLASLSGLSEPVGAIVALFVIDRESSDSINDENEISTLRLVWNAIWNMKNVLSFVAGIMTTVALVELFPEASRHMKRDVMPGYLGALLGVIVMLASDAYLDG